MPTPTLLASTGSSAADAAARDAITRFERGLPGRVRGYYLVGSYATGEARPSSDIDIIVVLAHEPSAAERELFAELRAQCRGASPIALDLSLSSAPQLIRAGGVWFQTASLLLYGDDIRPQVPRKPVEAHLRDLMHSVVPLLARVRGSPAVLRVPLDFPAPAGELRGYDARQLALGPPAAPTKDLVTNVLAAANALTLQRAGQYVGSGRKSDIPREYRRWVGDAWAGLVDDVFALCRVRWDYQLPSAPADQAYLRELCSQALGFENHFLAQYQQFLLAEPQAADPAAQLFAARRLGQVVFPGAAMIAALGHALAGAGPELRAALDLALCLHQA